MNEAVLVLTARRAYERGRVKKAVRGALVVLPVASLPLYQCLQVGRGAQMLAVIAAMTVLLILLLWRGEDYERGARIGLMAGLSPLLLPVFATLIAPMCSASICEFLPKAAIAGGFLAGMCVAGTGFARNATLGFWFSAISVTATLGTAGCLTAGVAGLGGMALGLAAGAVPVLAVHALRPSR